MKKVVGLLLGTLVVIGLMGTALAQDEQQQSQATMHAPPKVLVITREFLKPGKSGMTHEKSESAFIQAVERANSQTHYLAVDSMSGKSRSLFLFGYDSLADWEKDNRATQKNASLTGALDRAAVADGNLLDAVDQGVFVYSDEYSLRPNVDIPHMRYFEIEMFQIRPGHQKDWDEAVKLVKAAYEKSVPDARWATFERVYGGEVGTYLVFTPMKSLAEADEAMGEDKKFVAAMGDDGMKRLSELSAAAIESRTTNLFVFNPRMSYVAPEWIKADPEFWKPKTSNASATTPKKPVEKPAPGQ